MVWGIAILGITLLGVVALLLAEVFSVFAEDTGAATDTKADATLTDHTELDKAA